MGGGSSPGCAGRGGRSRDGVRRAGWSRVGKTAISPLYKPLLDPLQHRDLAPQRGLGHHSGLAARWGRGTIGTSHPGGSLQAWCPGRSEHFPGWLRAQEIPRGELMINHGRAGGLGGEWQPLASPRCPSCGDRGLGKIWGWQGSWGRLLGSALGVMAHPKGQDQPPPETSRPGQGFKSCRGGLVTKRGVSSWHLELEIILGSLTFGMWGCVRQCWRARQGM